jgi:carbon storage regulator
MLVLMRKPRQEIVIGSGAARVRVVVVRVQGEHVHLGVEAPKEVPVHRREVAEAIDAAAAGGNHG